MIVKTNQMDKIMSRDFKRKFFSMFNFLSTFVKVYIKRSLEKNDEKESIRVTQNQPLKNPPIRKRPINVNG